jgi:hypothetical protein
MSQAPLIVTAHTNSDDLRMRFFPPEHNFLRANVTMFQKLPPEHRPQIEEKLGDRPLLNGSAYSQSVEVQHRSSLPENMECPLLICDIIDRARWSWAMSDRNGEDNPCQKFGTWKQSCSFEAVVELSGYRNVVSTNSPPRIDIHDGPTDGAVVVNGMSEYLISENGSPMMRARSPVRAATS